ncbi:MAG: glycosyltransferase family 4 protein, partial [Christensenellaceae bacterium]
MTIVHIEDFFHPDAGYQVNILAKFMAEQGHKIFVITSEMQKIPAYLKDFFDVKHLEDRDRAYTQNTGVEIIRIPLVAYLSGRSIYSSHIFKKIDDIDPDILYVHGNDTYIGIRYALKLGTLSYPVVFDNHMVEMASHNKFKKLFRFFYRHFVTPRLAKHHSIVIRMVDSDFILSQYGIAVENSPIVGFGSDVLAFYPDMKIRMKMRTKLAVDKDDFVVVYAGKLDAEKGGLFLAQSIKSKFKCKSNIVFLILGNCVGEYGAIVENELNASENRIIRIPTQAYAQLPQYFQCADIAVFPKHCSLTYYDAQATGLPVVLEDNEIGLEREKHGSAVCFQAQNIIDFRKKIEFYA